MTDLTLKENEQWLNGYKAGYAQAQETDLAMPRKEWIGLTDEEISGCINATASLDKGQFLVEFSKAIEAKLKEKNT